MSVKSKLAGLEKRMHLGDLNKHCPLCVTRPAEVWMSHQEDPVLPPSTAAPCPLCGKGPMRIIVYTPLLPGIDDDVGPTLSRWE